MASCCIFFYARWIFTFSLAYLKCSAVWYYAFFVYEKMGLGQNFVDELPGLAVIFSPPSIVWHNFVELAITQWSTLYDAPPVIEDGVNYVFDTFFPEPKVWNFQ